MSRQFNVDLPPSFHFSAGTVEQKEKQLEDYLSRLNIQVTEMMKRLFNRSLNVGYVDRGNATAYDFEVGDLVTDGNWNELDLSAIVPAEAIAVYLRYVVQDDAVASLISFRKKDIADAFSMITTRTQVVDVVIDGNGIVACGEDRIIEYRTSAVTYSLLSITVLGWFI